MFNVDRTIAIIALLVAIYSVWYTRKTNNFKVYVDNALISPQQFNPFLLSFEVLNDSPKAIYLESVSISGEGLKLLSDHKRVESKESLAFPDDEQFPFPGTTLLPINKPVEFSYYIEKPVQEITITLTTNTYIRCFSKTISFTVIPHYCE